MRIGEETYMYRCHTCFYYIGHQRELLEIIQGLEPLEHFTHTFWAGGQPEQALAVQADVILADMRSLDAEAVGSLARLKRPEAELIVLADKAQAELLDLSAVHDVWTLPLTEAELRFRFRRWQEAWRLSKDLWQTSHFLEATINSVPNLIWYKTKDGIHEKVNDSFCRTVNKTKQQVEGRGHAYIWNVVAGHINF